LAFNIGTFAAVFYNYFLQKFLKQSAENRAFALFWKDERTGEVIEVVKRIPKVVLALVVFLLATPFIGLAQAGKGQTKQYFEFYLTGSIGDPGEETKSWTTKGGILQVRGEPYFANYMEVLVGGTHYHPVPAAYSCTMDRTINLATGSGAIRISESIVFDHGTLEIQSAETISGYGTPAYFVEGSFVGFGTGSLEGVKVDGTTWRESSGSHYRIGTVMGWPTSTP